MMREKRAVVLAFLTAVSAVYPAVTVRDCRARLLSYVRGNFASARNSREPETRIRPRPPRSLLFIHPIYGRLYPRGRDPTSKEGIHYPLAVGQGNRSMSGSGVRSSMRLATRDITGPHVQSSPATRARARSASHRRCDVDRERFSQ